MVKYKKILLTIIFFIYTFFSICNLSYANTKKITKEDLSNSLEKFSNSEYNSLKISNISIEDNVINFMMDNEKYSLNYDLTDKPTFSTECIIEKGMTYEEFNNKIDNLSVVLLGYVAIADIHGANIKDACIYFPLSLLGNLANSSSSTNNFYTIIDDSTLLEGATVEKTDDPQVIYTSEFENRIMEYVNKIYDKKQVLSDESGINSYLLTIEKTDTTDTSCKIKYTLSIKNDADFSKIAGITDQIADSFINKDITKENADLVVTLKVGQKCKFESNEKITGYEHSGYDCIERNEDNTIITAKSVGIQNGYLYIGNQKKSIYITVEENTDNSTLETIILKIDSSSNNIDSNNNQLQNFINNNNKLPQTGKNFEVKNLLEIICSIILFVSFIYNKNKKQN